MQSGTMRGVLRRVHLPRLRPGEVALEPSTAHHVRNVLRLGEGTAIEVFDDNGFIAAAVVTHLEPEVIVRIGAVTQAPGGIELVIASAVPKGDRADWMVEKLSELGCVRFIPLVTTRSVVLPEGKNKRDRWLRLAAESARQSRRVGVMQVGALTPLVDVLAKVSSSADAFYLSTEHSSEPILDALRGRASATLFIGPEGGWTGDEIALFSAHQIRGLKLTATILRVETAAVTAAAVASVVQSGASTS